MRCTRCSKFLVTSLQNPLLGGRGLAGKLHILCVKINSRIYRESYNEQLVVEQADIHVRRQLRCKRTADQPKFAEHTRTECCDGKFPAEDHRGYDSRERQQARRRYFGRGGEDRPR